MVKTQENMYPGKSGIPQSLHTTWDEAGYPVMVTVCWVSCDELTFHPGGSSNSPLVGKFGWTFSIDISHSVAMFSLRRIKSFLFAWLASARCKFSAGLAVQKQSFLFSRDSTWPLSEKGLLSSHSAYPQTIPQSLGQLQLGPGRHSFSKWAVIFMLGIL